MADERIAVAVGGRQLALTNLAKPLYPSGFTKGEVIDYYSRIAPVLLPHLAGRPLTMKRYPAGTAAPFFYAKNAPPGRPDWVRTVTLPAPGSTADRETIDYVVCDELATLVWCANLAAVELHTPQWRVSADGVPVGADQLVVDLDPGAPAALRECCAVALLMRELLPPGPVAKLSGSKGLQVYAAWPAGQGDVAAFARALAEGLEQLHPDLVVSRMTKTLRPGKVLLDWSQNSRAKTTVSPYSLRAGEQPRVSAPVSWAEVEACAGGAAGLGFTPAQVLDRVQRDGDVFAALGRPGPRARGSAG